MDSATAATASAAGGKFEVFLSFCGKDTRHGFTDFLYEDLVEARIRTFRDNEALHVGEEIGAELLEAIKDSKISIPIFSKNYASSKWCLDELAQMVECRESGQKIFPIFYYVKPSDVRDQTGSYEEAFRIHKKRKRSDKKSEETVEKWKKALTEVGQLKGWELQKETDRFEGRLVKIVVRTVLLELKKKYMVVSEDLVGIHHHLEEVLGLLNVNSTDVRIVGIHGMGGIGKTTIAKVIYSQLLEKFECCCFLADVREESKSPTGLLNLQKQLISNIQGGKPPNIANVDEGMNKIKDIVHRKKVLIVLDDVDEMHQFDNLPRKCDWFGSGSRIIVTTRNKAVLDFLGVDNKAYKVPDMEFNHSLQLFSQHAFREDLPPKDYDGLSRKITLTAAGLPLALKIIGSSLYGKKKAIWEKTLSKLKKIPNKAVQKKLRISYDALDDGQKEIFLDIACHFIGKSKINPLYMWEDCEFDPEIGVEELVLRSLVQIEGNDVLRMHDQLRDLGRDIIREESSNGPEERSRLYLHDDALGILERQKGTKMIQTLCMDRRRISCLKTELHFTDKEFRQLPNLRFLTLDKVELTGDFKHVFSELRWLDWYECPRNFSPTNFHLKNLVVLNLTDCKITDEWEAWSQIKEAKKLKALYLIGCEGLTRTPDFSTFATLEILYLSWCLNLFQIDPSIEALINLRVLDMRNTGITKLPDAIGNLKKLEEIDASHCFNLQGKIQSSIGRLSSLRILRLVHTKICSLPTSIRRLSSLQTLELTGCAELPLLPELPPSLTSLCVTCKFMGTFPSLSNLMNLKELSFYKCLNLVEIPGDIGKLSKLESLTFNNTNITSLPAEIGALSCLKELDVQDCSKLMEIQGLEKLERLTSLDISACKSLERFSDLSNLMQLKKLAAVNCEKLIEIQGLDRLESLQDLDMMGCKCIKTLADLSNLRMLTRLNLYNCKKLAEVRGLSGLKSLERLEMSFCTSLKRLPNLSNLGMLKELRLVRCKKLAEVESLGALKSLETLDFSYCTSLVKVDGLGALESLERLNMSGCTSLERLPDLSNLKNLRELIISYCRKQTEIRGLEELKSLRLLTIYGCDWIIGKLPDLPNTTICPHSMGEEDERRKRQEITVVDVAGRRNILSL